MPFHPMPLVRIPEPFDHPEWLWELKWDGFRALAFIEGHECRLVSRRGHTYKCRRYLQRNVPTRFAPTTLCSMVRSSVWMMMVARISAIFCSAGSGRSSTASTS